MLSPWLNIADGGEFLSDRLQWGFSVAFLFLRHALIFCGVAVVLALFADILLLLSLSVAAHLSTGGVGFLLTRGRWVAIFAVWWILSFLIALPVARKFSGLPFPLL